MSKLRLGLYWAASCGGCEIAVLEIHEKILDLLAVADIVFWPCVMDFKYSHVAAMDDGAIDVCLFNGGIRNDENLRVAQLLRQKSKALVAYGACSSMGGVPGLANLYSREAMMERAFVGTESTDNPERVIPSTVTELGPGMDVHLPEVFPHVRTLGQVVPVDYVVPGCPPVAAQTWAVIEAVAAGQLPAPGETVVGAGDRAVCDECPLERRHTRVDRFLRPHEVIPDGTTCLLEQGLVCTGPATRSGCDARCPSVGLGCRGCYGPAAGVADPGAKMIGVLGSLVGSNDPEEIARCVDGVSDPAGTFYRFGLPASPLGRSRGPRGGSS